MLTPIVSVVAVDSSTIMLDPRGRVNAQYDDVHANVCSHLQKVDPSTCWHRSNFEQSQIRRDVVGTEWASSLVVSERLRKTVFSEQICWVRAEPLGISRILASLGSRSRATRPTSSGRSA